jgi:hypothetical protein
MSTATKPPLRQGSPNDFQTPPEALYPLLKYIKKDGLIWFTTATSYSNFYAYNSTI